MAAAARVRGRVPARDPPQHGAGGGNCGADSVNWYDASAFYHWLGTGLKAEIRLPTEAEWQFAATAGDPERVYPWGPDWDARREPWRANTVESRLERTLPVGFYPLGASPAGLMDMSGNLWQWCRNWYDQNETTRVLRGGSWFDRQDSARSAYRGGSNPSLRGDNVGFRLVCSSP